MVGKKVADKILATIAGNKIGKRFSSIAGICVNPLHLHCLQEPVAKINRQRGIRRSPK